MATNQKTSPLFSIIENIDLKNRDYVAKMSADDMKSVAPYVLYRWLSGPNDPVTIVLMNRFVRPYIFELYKHPRLLLYLMVACSLGRKRRTVYPKTEKSVTFPISIKLLSTYFQCNQREAVDMLPNISNSDIIECAENLGWQPPEITKLKAELKTRVSA